MINLAGKENCDDWIRLELEEAGIDYTEFGTVFRRREVPSKIIGEYKGWLFTRAWYYWVAGAGDGSLLLFDDADKLHEKCGQDVRVAGHCCAPAPREWYKHPWQIGVDMYRVDTQEGLNELVKTIDLSIERQGKG